MDVSRLKRILMPFIAARAYSNRAFAPQYARPLRALRQRVAAARLGVGRTRPTVRQTVYEDLQ